MRSYKIKGLIFAAFGLGMILALCFPTKFMLFMAAAMLILFGISIC